MNITYQNGFAGVEQFVSYGLYAWLQLQHFIMTSSNENIFRVTGPLCGEFTGPHIVSVTQRP